MYQSPRLIAPAHQSAFGSALVAKCHFFVGISLISIVIGAGGMMVMQVVRILG